MGPGLKSRSRDWPVPAELDSNWVYKNRLIRPLGSGPGLLRRNLVSFHVFRPDRAPERGSLCELGQDNL